MAVPANTVNGKPQHTMNGKPAFVVNTPPFIGPKKSPISK